MRTIVTVALTSRLGEAASPLSAAAWATIKNFVGSFAGDTGPPGIENPLDAIARCARERLPASSAAEVVRLLDQIPEFEAELEAFRSRGIEVVTEFDHEYPLIWKEKLKDRCPPVVFVAGNAAILNTPSIGIVGSRQVDENGERFAREVAEEVASRGRSVVSGGAKGVDQISMRGAFNAGGRVLGILVDSLWRLAGTEQTQALLGEGRLCLCTPFSPRAGFQVGNAMARNRLIYAHSSATVVVSSARETGGTWAGATEAIRKRLCPVLVRSGANVPDGNVALLQRGGVPLGSPADTFRVAEEAPRVVQQSLF